MPNRKEEIRDLLESLPTESSERAALETELQEIIAEEQAMSAINLRFQEKEENIQSLKLPYDFNELYGDSTANDSIIEVVQIFRREDNVEHTAEMQSVINAHREEMRAASERELQLKRQNDELQELFDRETKQAQLDAVELNQLDLKVSQLELELKHANAQRDAAVREKEGIELLLQEKQEHIEKLRDEMAIGASRAINVTEVKATDRLAALVEQSKSAKIKSSVELALERMEPVRGKIDVAVAAPKLPEEAVPSYTVVNGLDNIKDSGILATDKEVTFQLPSAQAPEVPALSTPVVEGKQSVEVPGITEAQLEDRLVKFAQEHGLVKQAVA